RPPRSEKGTMGRQPFRRQDDPAVRSNTIMNQAGGRNTMDLKDQPILRAASLIRSARRMALISGAGMSVDSGVKDFRSKSGWWRGIDPRTVANQARRHAGGHPGRDPALKPREGCGPLRRGSAA